MNDTVIYENKDDTRTWKERFQYKSAWKDFLDQGSNPYGLEYYLTLKFRQKQSHDDIKERINPLLKRFITRKFGFRRLIPTLPMKFIFFIEEGRSSEGFHSHCVFSVPQKWSGFNLDTLDPEFIKRDNEVRRNVRSALERFTYFPVNPHTGQIGCEVNSRKQRLESLILNEMEYWNKRLLEIENRPIRSDTYHQWKLETEKLKSNAICDREQKLKEIKESYSRPFKIDDETEMWNDPNSPKPLIRQEGKGFDEIAKIVRIKYAQYLPNKNISSKEVQEILDRKSIDVISPQKTKGRSKEVIIPFGYEGKKNEKGETVFSDDVPVLEENEKQQEIIHYMKRLHKNGFDLRQIYSLNSLISNYHLKELWKNNDCLDERNSDLPQHRLS
jgi:hypothetical protein